MNTLAAQRCLRHMDREAAARCPECRGFFCRECISEHDGRVLCATCLSRLHAASKRKAHSWSWLHLLGRTALTLAACGLVWGVVYLGGRALLLIPSAFHDGTLWRQMPISGE
jgi:hypothetical protein